jgi:hypothetical protein
MDSLPTEIVSRILKYVSWKDCLNIYATSRSLYRTALWNVKQWDELVQKKFYGTGSQKHNS